MPYDIINAAIFLLILVAAALHHQRLRHVKLMKLCFVLDLALLIAVEFLRDKPSAVAKAIGTMTHVERNNVVLAIHIAFSVLVLVLWVVQLVRGSQVLRGNASMLPSHARWAKYFLLVRAGNVITAFMV